MPVSSVSTRNLFPEFLKYIYIGSKSVSPTYLLMSRNARRNENGRFDEISPNRVNVNRFDDYSGLLSTSSKWNQLGVIHDFDEFLSEGKECSYSDTDIDPYVA